MSKYHNRWTEAETAMGRAMLARDAAPGEFWAVLGRSKKAAQARIRALDFPRDYSNRDRKSEALVGIHVNPKAAKIPEAVQADAKRRQLAPRTITALICGDPAPGQSALDKREERI